MKNHDIYVKDPSQQKLVNEGVASVNDFKEEVLRYELDTFVCDGQYEKGIEHILYTYIDNLNQSQQPAVWVSGFYGSGKSHLVKMLALLWSNMEFSDGATPRGIACLPQSVKDLFKELSIKAKQHGYLHSASGTLKANDDSNSVRTALLSIIFKSVGLPNKYHLAAFVMWLKEEGLFEQVKAMVEGNGKNWESEIRRLHVSKLIRQALVEAKPDIFFDEKTCAETLRNQFPSGKDVANDDMIDAIKQALTVDGKFPLTLIVLDEVQQYIGDDSLRSDEVREMVEACCKNIGSKLLFIGTGQTAVTGTANLKKQEGRFTIRIELSDQDVDTVVRKVVLAKKSEAISEIKQIMQDNIGEISKHLNDSNIGHKREDVAFFSQDYPILPSRRRFWEYTLRVLDQTGTESQLRNQLGMVHKTIQTNLDKDLGFIIAADYLYFDAADKLLQARVLPRNVHEKTMTWLEGTSDEKLMARACGLIFLVNKLSSSNKEVGISATVDIIADLMVEDLKKGSSELRSSLPKILDKCELVMKVGEEYRIQTEESAAWNDEFQKQRSVLSSGGVTRIELERNDKVRSKFSNELKKKTIVQGASKVARNLSVTFDSSLPRDADKKLYVWVRDGWSIGENSVRIEAKEVGNNSPIVFVFIPKRSADDIRHYIIELKSAISTIEIRGENPNTPEGIEACAAMKTLRDKAKSKINELLNECMSGAKVYQGGGSEIIGNNLQEMILEAGKKSLQRLYPQFTVADSPHWDKVYSKAKQGAADALKSIGYDGEVGKNPVCKIILTTIGSGKKGTDIREILYSSPYGWSGDAVDGGLQILLTSSLITATDDKSKPVVPNSLERKYIGKTNFKVESTTVSMAQKIQIRKLLQKMGIKFNSGEELVKVPEFLMVLTQLADKAGGDAPMPQKPDTSFLDGIKYSTGNDQLILIYNLKDDISKFIDNWKAVSETISNRIGDWQNLQKLSKHIQGLKDSEMLNSQISDIENNRLLLNEPDQINPLIKKLSQMIREELNWLNKEYEKKYNEGTYRLGEDQNWNTLEQEQKYDLMSSQNLHEKAKPEIQLGTTRDILNTINCISIDGFNDRVAALTGRFDNVAMSAAKICEPEIQEVSLPGKTLKTTEDIDEWINEVKELLLEKIKNGPVIYS